MALFGRLRLFLKTFDAKFASDIATRNLTTSGDSSRALSRRWQRDIRRLFPDSRHGRLYGLGLASSVSALLILDALRRRDRDSKTLSSQRRSNDGPNSVHTATFNFESLRDSARFVFDYFKRVDSFLLKFPPTVHAARPPQDNMSTSSSSKFNFIADTVERSCDAVVNIEVDGALLQSNGSGFIVSADGVIVTNAHVVRNKLQRVKVKLPDGRSYRGMVTALDTSIDLAVIKLESLNENLPVMRLGSSTKVRTGEWVIAMGSPLQLKNTITVGVVSTVHRSSQDLGLNKNIDYIQTDASITFGNSGGPLVNLDGEAIGINTIKMTEGISFAIPIDAVKDFLKWAEGQAAPADTQTGGFFSRFKWNQPPEADKRNYIGITMLTLTPAIIMELKSRHAGFPEIRGGIFVHRVVENSPAEKGGLIAGDILLGINGKEIRSTNEVYEFVAKESKLNLTLLRNQKVTYATIYPEEILVK